MTAKLEIHCTDHPRYRAVNKSRTNCQACFLMFILRHTHDPETSWKVDGPNIFQFIDGDVETVASPLRIRPR